MLLEHSPTPWKAYLREECDGFWEIDHSGDGGLDCRLSREDAEFICRACNSHEGLVEALKGMLSITEHDSWDYVVERKIRARDMIKQAEGG